MTHPMRSKEGIQTLLQAHNIEFLNIEMIFAVNGTNDHCAIQLLAFMAGVMLANNGMDEANDLILDALIAGVKSGNPPKDTIGQTMGRA